MAAFGNDLFSVFEADDTSSKGESSKAGIKRKSNHTETKEPKKKVEVSITESLLPKGDGDLSPPRLEKSCEEM